MSRLYSGTCRGDGLDLVWTDADKCSLVDAELEMRRG
jgi:hypothetical protein